MIIGLTAIDQMIIDQTTTDQMIIDQMIIDQTTIDQVNLDKMNLDLMILDQTNITQMNLDQENLGQINLANPYLPKVVTSQINMKLGPMLTVRMNFSQINLGNIGDQMIIITLTQKYLWLNKTPGMV